MKTPPLPFLSPSEIKYHICHDRKINCELGIVLDFRPVSTSSARRIYHYLLTYVRDGEIRQRMYRRKDVGNLTIDQSRVKVNKIIEELNEAYSLLQEVVSTYNPATDYYLYCKLVEDYNFIVKKVKWILETHGHPKAKSFDYIATMHILGAKIP